MTTVSCVPIAARRWPPWRWSDDADKWAADIPAGYSEDDDFDYEEFIRREFPDRQSPARWLRRLLFAVLVAVLVLVLVLALAPR